MSTLATVLIELGGLTLVALLLAAIVSEARDLIRQWGPSRRRLPGRRPYDWRIDE